MSSGEGLLEAKGVQFVETQGLQGSSSRGSARSLEWLLCRAKVGTVGVKGLHLGSDRDQAFSE